MMNNINDDVIRDVINNNTNVVIYINNDVTTTTIYNAERISYNRWEITSAGEKALLLSNEELLGVIKLFKMYNSTIEFKFNKDHKVSITDDVVDIKGGIGQIIISGVLLRNYIKYLGNTVSFNCCINKGGIGEFKLVRFEHRKKVCSYVQPIDTNNIDDKSQYQFTLYKNTSVYQLKKINRCNDM